MTHLHCKILYFYQSPGCFSWVGVGGWESSGIVLTDRVQEEPQTAKTFFSNQEQMLNTTLDVAITWYDIMINPHDVNDVSCTSTIMLIKLNLIKVQWMERKKQSRLSIVCGYVFSIGLSSPSLKAANSGVRAEILLIYVWRPTGPSYSLSDFNDILTRVNGNFSFLINYLCSKRSKGHNYFWLQCIFRDCWRLPHWSGHWPKTFHLLKVWCFECRCHRE